MLELLTSITSIVSSIQDCIDQLGQLPIVFVSFNFLVAAFVSYISVPIYMAEIKDTFALLTHLEQVAAQKKNVSGDYQFFIFRYAIVTGIGAAGLLYIQFHGPNFGTAVIYGLLGPYVIKERISTHVDAEKDEIIKELENKAASIGKVDNKYNEERKKIISEIKKEYDELHGHH